MPGLVGAPPHRLVPRPLPDEGLSARTFGPNRATRMALGFANQAAAPEVSQPSNTADLRLVRSRMQLGELAEPRTKSKASELGCTARAESVRALHEGASRVMRTALVLTLPRAQSLRKRAQLMVGRPAAGFAGFGSVERPSFAAGHLVWLLVPAAVELLEVVAWNPQRTLGARPHAR
jgi:hypothetical protein